MVVIGDGEGDSSCDMGVGDRGGMGGQITSHALRMCDTWRRFGETFSNQMSGQKGVERVCLVLGLDPVKTAHDVAVSRQSNP